MTLPNKDHLPGIDWIRAFASLAVVAMHYEAFGGWIKGYVLCLAVPLFLFVSVYLFVRKPRTTSDWAKRSTSLLILFLIWPILFYVSNGGLPLLFKTAGSAAKAMAAQPVQTVYYLISGLETVYYFFFSLALVLTVAHLLRHRSTILLLVVFVFASASVAALPFVANGQWAVFNNPLNFLPFAPAALLLVRFEARIGQAKWLVGLLFLILGASFALAEVGAQSATPVSMMAGYSRVSLAFLAAGLVVLSLSVRRSNRVIAFLSRHSLPLYVFHTCLFAVVWPLVGAGYSGMLHGPEAGLHVVAWMVAVALSYLVSVFIAPRILDPRLYRG